MARTDGSAHSLPVAARGIDDRVDDLFGECTTDLTFSASFRGQLHLVLGISVTAALADEGAHLRGYGCVCGDVVARFAELVPVQIPCGFGGYCVFE